MTGPLVIGLVLFIAVLLTVVAVLGDAELDQRAQDRRDRQAMRRHQRQRAALRGPRVLP